MQNALMDILLLFYSYRPLQGALELKSIVERFKKHQDYDTAFKHLIGVDPSRITLLNRSKHQQSLLRQHV